MKFTFCLFMLASAMFAQANDEVAPPARTTPQEQVWKVTITGGIDGATTYSHGPCTVKVQSDTLSVSAVTDDKTQTNLVTMIRDAKNGWKWKFVSEQALYKGDQAKPKTVYFQPAPSKNSIIANSCLQHVGALPAEIGDAIKSHYKIE